MKTKRFLTFLLAILAIASLIPIASTTARALEVSDKVKEVELTLTAPKAGETVNLSISSVEAKHHMTYKVVGLRWYKQGDDRQMGVESGADTYFIGDQSYTVEVDLEVKSGNGGWNLSYEAYEIDYSGIHATINGKTAIVKYPPLNSDKQKTITVAYTFSYIADGIINYPNISIPTPIAGNLPPKKEDLKVGYPRATWLPSTDYLWYVYENNAWRKMEQNEHYAAGARYKVELAIQTNEGFRFNIENADDYRNDGGKQIWGYINGDKRTMALKALGAGQYADEIVFVTYEFASCEAQYVDSVSFSGIIAPSATQHPQYNPPVMTGSYTLFDDEEFTGGAQFNFVNGIQWTSVNGLLDATSVFEMGGVYSMTFFIKTFDTHRFTDWVDGNANIGYVDVMVLPDDPTIAMVTVTFAPCDGGVLSEVNISGIKNPIHGEAPDYEFTYGEGYDLGTSADAIVWYDLTANKKLLSTDTFVYGHEYELRIILRSEKQILGASNGKFEFASHDALTVKANGITATKLERYNNNPESNWVLASIPFECEKHTIEQLVITVDNPVEGMHPAKQVEKGDDTYNIEEFMFVDCDTDMALNAEGVFAGGKSYRFVLAVTPKEGFKFENGITAAKVNGQDAGVLFANEDGVLIVLNLLSEELPYYTISFSSGEGMGTMSSLTVKGGLITLPECEFTPPDEKTFAGWSTDGGMTLLTGEYDVTESVDFEAIYVEAGVHRHVYSEGYDYSDDTFHYKSCIDIENCDDPNGSIIYSMHDYGNNSNCDDTCTVCGYIRTQGLGGEALHFYEHECSEVCPNCGLEREAAPHTPGAEATCTEAQKCTVCQKVLEEAKGHTPGAEANCGHDQTCTVCGEVLVPATGEHTPGDEADCGHDQTCTVCGEILVPATGEHTAGAPATCTTAQTCTVCGEELAPAHGHSVGVEWICDENEHYKLCGCGEKLDKGEHIDEDGDKLCDVCKHSLKKGLSTGAIIGIVAGSVAGAGAIAFLVYWFLIKKKTTVA